MGLPSGASLWSVGGRGGTGGLLGDVLGGEIDLGVRRHVGHREGGGCDAGAGDVSPGGIPLMSDQVELGLAWI